MDTVSNKKKNIRLLLHNIVLMYFIYSLLDNNSMIFNTFLQNVLYALLCIAPFVNIRSILKILKQTAPSVNKKLYVCKIFLAGIYCMIYIYFLIKYLIQIDLA